MTPTRLHRLLGARPDTAGLCDLDPPELAVALEHAVEADPSDRELERLTTAAWTWVELSDVGPAEAEGLRLGTVVRWDGWSATYEAVDSLSGEEVLARVLRAHARTPAHRRRLARDGRVLVDRLGVPVHTRPGALVVPTGGGPLVEGPPPRDDLGLRAVCRVIADLVAREEAGWGALEPDARELRLAEHGARVLCLHVDVETGDLGEVVHRLALVLPEGPVEAALDGARELPPARPSELADVVLAGLAQDLAGRRHDAVRRWRSRRKSHDKARLRALTERLARWRPPAGRGAVGVDLEGRPTVLEGDGHTLAWGPLEGPTLSVVSEQGLHPRTARRLLRARSAAPPSERINRMVDGDAAYTERACRWVAAALSLRTVRLLLEVPT